MYLLFGVWRPWLCTVMGRLPDINLLFLELDLSLQNCFSINHSRSLENETSVPKPPCCLVKAVGILLWAQCLKVLLLPRVWLFQQEEVDCRHWCCSNKRLYWQSGSPCATPMISEFLGNVKHPPPHLSIKREWELQLCPSFIKSSCRGLTALKKTPFLTFLPDLLRSFGVKTLFWVNSDLSQFWPCHHMWSLSQRLFFLPGHLLLVWRLVVKLQTVRARVSSIGQEWHLMGSWVQLSRGVYWLCLASK